MSSNGRRFIDSKSSWKVLHELIINSPMDITFNFYCKTIALPHLCVWLYSIEIPIGNTINLGAYEECLSVSHHEVVNATTYNIIGM